MVKPHNIAGQAFGRLTAIKIAGRFPVGQRGQVRIFWECACSCGKSHLVDVGRLRSGLVRSCGCRKFEKKPDARIRLNEYHIYRGIIARCENQNVKAFPAYGGAGVKISARWRASFDAFLEDMGPRPSKKHSVDRWPDPSGDYEPGNCRWATQTEQCRNRNNTRYVIYRGTKMPLTQAVEMAGSVIHPQGAWNRIRVTGWAVEEAVETPRLMLSPTAKARIKRDPASITRKPSGSFWAKIRIRVFRRDDYTCQYCGTQEGKLECDHVLPLCRGGKTTEENLKTSCFDCNRSKRDLTLDEWMSVAHFAAPAHQNNTVGEG